MAKARKHVQARFWRKLMRLTRGRVPLLRALEIIAAEEASVAFRSIVCAIREAMEGGAPLSEAVCVHDQEFSLAVIELVRAAEKSGAWDEVLEEIAGGLEEGTFR